MIKSAPIKVLLRIALICISIPAISQTKDTTGSIRKIPCQVVLSGTLSVGYDSTYHAAMAIDQLLKDPVVRTAGCGDYTITSFSLVSTDGNSIYDEKAFNDHLTPNMIDIVKKAMKGNNIIIQDVHYRTATGQTGTMPGITFTIN